MNPYLNGHHLKVGRLPFSDKLRGICSRCGAWAEQTATGALFGSAVTEAVHDWQPTSPFALKCRGCNQLRGYGQREAKPRKCSICPAYKLVIKM